MRWRAREVRGPTKSAAQPQGNRRVTTPLLLQMHATECGAACLGSVLAYFGRWVPLNELRTRCGVSRDGTTAAGIMRAARHYGLECSGYALTLEDLKKYPLPLILFWEFNHFVVIEGFDRQRYYINDPAFGRRALAADEFSKSYSGVALQFAPGASFARGGESPNILSRLPRWLRGSGPAFAYAVVCGLGLALLALTVPALLAVFVDHVLVGGDPWAGPIAGAVIAAAVLVCGLTWLKQRCLQRLAVRIAVVAGNRHMTQLLRLPVEFFNHRIAGELSARVLSIDRIATGLSEHFLALVVEVAMSVLFLAVILVYQPLLALIVIGLAVLNAAAAWTIARLQTDRSHALQREQRLFTSIGTLMLHHVETLRMTAADDGLFSRWGGFQARELVAHQRLGEIRHVYGALSIFFMVLGGATALIFSAFQVMAGELTLGMLVGFYILVPMFLSPIGRLVEFAGERRSLEVDMQRLDDITESENTAESGIRVPSSESIATLDGRLQLAGSVELRDVTFGYNRARPPLIQDFNLKIEPGQRVAVVGASGSGKSTLSRLVSGVHEPWDGEILFDGRPHGEIPGEVLSRSVSIVDQDVILFSATVRDNITLWSPSVPDEAVVAAARDACIHDEILTRPRGYETPVNEDGSNFSGGQRQRLEIARALVGSPTILILDEATSALDAATEQRIDHALRRRGVSCLIIAHRLSTIRDCDEIIVLGEGGVVQRGTHEELMADETGVYRRLVQSG